ncbi:MAG: segregation/condensation protein A [Sphingobacteriaceae bacterium]|nr:segregation/condensation protein A [Sphingobacteriaceae bacterium]
MIQQDTFEIRLPQFAGPFDLLLFFIERDELDIRDIQIAKITDDFLDYIHQMNALNIELASEFIFIAATLMRIKAKMLLPMPDLDEEGNEIDLKKDLVQKLIEYKRFKLISETFRHLEEERFKQEKRGNISTDLQRIAENSAESGEELGSVGLYRLLMIYEKSMSRYESKQQDVKHTVIQYPYTIEQQKKVIGELIELNQKMDFSKLMKNSDNKVHFVYNFLAILEMLQQQLISIQIGLGFNNFSVAGKTASSS